MIKKILSAIFLLAFLTSCTAKTKNCDIFEFIKRINDYSDEIIVEIEDIIVSEENILYWCPDKTTCVSFYINNKTGNIEKCNVAYKNNNEELLSLIEKTLCFNNEYISKSTYKSSKYCLITYTDSRYTDKSEQQTLKKEINEKDSY